MNLYTGTVNVITKYENGEKYEIWETNSKI